MRQLRDLAAVLFTPFNQLQLCNSLRCGGSGDEDNQEEGKEVAADLFGEHFIDSSLERLQVDRAFQKFFRMLEFFVAVTLKL
jgi:hypothetical protein